jgi:two-component system response regulator BaeR
VIADDRVFTADAPLPTSRSAVWAPGPDTAIATLLVAVDDPFWSGGGGPELEREGFRCVLDPEGRLVFEAEVVAMTDVAIVDLGLRHSSGLAVCAAFRARSAAPMIATARFRDENAALDAFAAGADQFISFDVSARQVVARLRALLRRWPAGRGRAPGPVGGTVQLDEQDGALVAGRRVPLLREEYEILRALLARPGRVVSRRDLLILSGPGALGTRSLDVVIRRLRQKLEAIDGVRRISAVRGVGFCFDEDGCTAPGGSGV